MPTATQPDASIARHIGYVAAVTAAILLVPLVAMQLTTEVMWTFSDFLLMGAVLMGFGTVFVFAARFVKTRQHRMLLGAALTLLTMFIWAELAVGVVGSPFAGS